MALASYRGVVLAESDDVVVVEGNVYFPASSLRMEHLLPSDTHTTCSWKGLASYYHVAVPDQPTNTDAAWFYPSPKEAAKELTGRVAFWRGVEVKR